MPRVLSPFSVGGIVYLIYPDSTSTVPSSLLISYLLLFTFLLFSCLLSYPSPLYISILYSLISPYYVLFSSVLNFYAKPF